MRDEEAEQFLQSMSEEERYATWHLVLRSGRLVGRGRGIVELLGAVRLTRPAARVVEVVPDAALEGFYRLVAAHRGRLGRLVPDGPAPKRFP